MSTFLNVYIKLAYFLTPFIVASTLTAETTKYFKETDQADRCVSKIVDKHGDFGV
jgi:hypothetical protein